MGSRTEEAYDLSVRTVAVWGPITPRLTEQGIVDVSAVVIRVDAEHRDRQLAMNAIRPSGYERLFAGQ